jgi:hypothetical protein
LGALLEEVTVLYALGLAVVDNFWTLTDDAVILLLFLLEGILILTFTLSFFRLFSVYWGTLKGLCQILKLNGGQ